MKAELMRYRNDRLSSMLTLIGLCLDACLLICIYSTGTITLKGNDDFGFIIGVDTIYNIVFLLFAFYASEKVKTYSMNWCFVSGGLGVLQLPRILLPIMFHNAGQLNGLGFAWSIICIVLSAGALIASCCTSFVKSRKLNEYLKQNKNEVA